MGKVKKTMTNLVDGPLLLPREDSVVVYGIFFEEIANFVARCEKVVVTDMVIVARGEFGLCLVGGEVRRNRDLVINLTNG